MSDQEMRRVFQDAFNSLLERDRVSQKEIATVCGVSTSTVSTWSKGLNIPRMDKIDALAKHFNVPRSYFVERGDALGDPADELIAAYGEVKEHLTEDDISDIKKLMRLRAELNRGEK